MKKIITLMVTALVALAANAKATLTGPKDGVITVDVESAGDLASYNFSSLTSEQKACTSFYIKGNIGQNDLIALASEFTVNNLDLTDASSIDGAWVLTSDLYSYKTVLETFTFPKYLTSVDGQWVNQSNVKHVIIPNGIGNGSTEVSVNGFGQMKSLETVVIGTGVTSIGSSAFQEDTSLKVLDIRAGIKTIGRCAFQQCPIEDIVLPEGLEEIQSNAFEGAKMSSLHLPSTLTYIRSNAFMNCNNLLAVTIPANVKLIGSEAFKCRSIADVYVLGTETQAASGAFDPMTTYDGIKYTPNGDVDRTDWMGAQDCNPTLLHYPTDAREKYLNGRILNPENYPDFFTEGIEWPTDYPGWNNTLNENTEYKGWQEFMLTSVITDDEIFIVDNIIDDTWYTMCFPFDLTVSQLYTAFGEFTEVCEFVKAEVTGDVAKSIEFQFKRWVGEGKKANDIVAYANKPYMIHPNLGVKTGESISRRIVIAGINKLETEDQTPWTSNNYKQGEDGEYIFVGNYKNQSIPQYAYFLGCKNGKVTFIKKLATCNQNSEKSRWNPFTAIIMTGAEFDGETSFWTCANDGVTESSMVITALSKINDDNQEVITGISEIQNEEKAQSADDNIIRNINGQVVRRGTISLEGLPKGLYIVNGKKYMVR